MHASLSRHLQKMRAQIGQTAAKDARATTQALMTRPARAKLNTISEDSLQLSAKWQQQNRSKPPALFNMDRLLKNGRDSIKMRGQTFGERPDVAPKCAKLNMDKVLKNGRIKHQNAPKLTQD
jgi:hypothetical protein